MANGTGGDLARSGRHDPSRRSPGIALLLVGLVGVALSCARPVPRPRLDYTPEQFKATVRERVPALADTLARAPFEVDREVIERALDVIESVPLGEARVRALVEFLQAPEPRGLGLAYDWSVTATASEAIGLRRGNCLSLASVMVGIGRGLGWPVYYAEARPPKPETQQFEEVRALSDHMIVIIVAKTVRMSVDFTGLLKRGYDIRPISDLTAYAHFVNNRAGSRVMTQDRTASDSDWRAAREGFELATRLEPSLGRAWNNLGIVYRRLGRIDDAREAYHRALALDAGFGSAEHNLSLMETRKTDGTSVISVGTPKP